MFVKNSEDENNHLVIWAWQLQAKVLTIGTLLIASLIVEVTPIEIIFTLWFGTDAEYSSKCAWPRRESSTIPAWSNQTNKIVQISSFSRDKRWVVRSGEKHVQRTGCCPRLISSTSISMQKPVNDEENTHYFERCTNRRHSFHTTHQYLLPWQ